MVVGGDRLEKKRVRPGEVQSREWRARPEGAAREALTFADAWNVLLTDSYPASAPRKASAGRELAAFYAAYVSQLCPSSAMLCTAW